eukprot:COSAG05_NODE_1962_length_3773_cov_127.334194_3_plen_58_part_00
MTVYPHSRAAAMQCMVQWAVSTVGDSSDFTPPLFFLFFIVVSPLECTLICRWTFERI